MRTALGACLLTLLWPVMAMANPHEAAVPLQDGQLSLTTLGDCLAKTLHVPVGVVHFADIHACINMQGISGWVAVRALNQALGDGFQIRITKDSLIVDFDPDKLPHDWDADCDAACRFVQITAPQATARQQRRFGLMLPSVVDSKQPMVVLIHGLDGDAVSCADIGALVKAEGHQTAYFAYPADQPLARSAMLLGKNLAALHDLYPNMPVDLITESMGGLIARQYLEGPDYAGGVARLIMIAPPNSGSNWAPFSIMVKLSVNAADWWEDPDWSPTWMITEGVCQAGHDLEPGSKFLAELNSRPRRGGVRYTIIAGDRPVGYRVGAVALELGSSMIPNVWYGSQLRSVVVGQVEHLLHKTGQSDGPVSLDSAHLAGVDDFVAVSADHLSLFKRFAGHPPAAWPIIQQRLDEQGHGR